MIRLNSLLAYFDILPDLQRREKEVLTALFEIEPATNYQIKEKLGWEINQVTGRTKSLKDKEYIKELDTIKQKGYSATRLIINEEKIEGVVINVK